MIDKALLLDVPDGDTVSTQDPLVFEKEVIYVDSFTQRDPNTGELLNQFTVTEADIDQWIATHQELVGAGLDVPMPKGHTEDSDARQATALSLAKKTDSKGRVGLFTTLKFKDAQAALAHAQSQVSLYSPPVYHHGEKTFHRPIRHICFTDYPAIPGLDPLTTIAASVEQRKPMKDLAKKLGLKLSETATDAEIEAAIVAHHAELAKPKTPTAPATPGTGASNPSDTMLLSLTRDNRKMKIDRLVLDHRITTAAGDELKKTWASDALMLSTENNAAFDSIVASLEKLDPIKALGGQQSPGQRVEGEESPLVKQARKMAEKK